MTAPTIGLEYLVQYGSSAFVGRFRTDTSFHRGKRVVVESPRGVELGTVLCEPHEKFARSVARTTDGQILRPAHEGDELAAERAQERANQILDAAQTEMTGLPVGLLDCEVLLGDSGAILHLTTWDAVDLTTTLERLSEQHSCPIRVHDLTTTASPVPQKGCGSGGCSSGSGGCSSCGTGGGGCGSGSSCSRGKVPSSESLTAYFLDLRQKMEQQVAGRRELA